MVAPDVEIDDGKGTILVSSEEGETEGVLTGGGGGGGGGGGLSLCPGRGGEE